MHGGKPSTTIYWLSNIQQSDISYKDKIGILPSYNWVSIIAWLHDEDFNETSGLKSNIETLQR